MSELPKKRVRTSLKAIAQLKRACILCNSLSERCKYVKFNPYPITGNRARIFKPLRNPIIDSKEPIPPSCVGWQAGSTTLFLHGSQHPQIVSKFQHRIHGPLIYCFPLPSGFKMCAGWGTTCGTYAHSLHRATIDSPPYDQFRFFFNFHRCLWQRSKDR